MTPCNSLSDTSTAKAKFQETSGIIMDKPANHGSHPKTLALEAAIVVLIFSYLTEDLTTQFNIWAQFSDSIKIRRLAPINDTKAVVKMATMEDVTSLIKRIQVSSETVICCEIAMH